MRALKSFGVKFARRAVFMPKLLRPDAASLLALLWGVRAKLDRIPQPPTPGITSFDVDEDAPPDGFLAAAGFHVVGLRAIRLDMLDRLEQELELAAATGQAADAAVPKLVSLLGCDRATLDEVLAALGWARVAVTGGEATASVWRQSIPRSRNRRRDRRTLPTPRYSPDSPFAGLAALIAAD
jgi:ATP-dependent RNA helicase SUPV3L1/SUV3